MTTKLYVAMLMLFIVSAQASAKNQKTLTEKSQLNYPVIVRVYFEETSELQPLVDEFDVWNINRAQKFATVQLNEQSNYHKLLNQGLKINLDDKLMAQYTADLARINNAEKSGAGIPGFSCYSTVSETFQKMQQLESDQPDLVELVDIGDSWEKIQNGSAGEDLRVIKITNENIVAEKPILFMASSIHAREYATAELNTRFAQYLVVNYGINADVTWILDNNEIHLSLVTNPDGRKQAQTGVLWRKNTNNNHCGNSNSRGVDLNRNYPFQWGIGGSKNACSDVFFGPFEVSEPEVDSQVAYLRQIFEDNRGTGSNDAAADDTAGIFVDIHSFGQLVLWPWGYTTSVTPNDNQLQALGKRTAFFNNYFPQPVNELVITGGGSIDAIYGELGVASLAFELGTSFFQDCDSFEETIFPDNLNALMYLARVTQAPYTQPLGPDINDFSIIPNVITAGIQVSINGVANDDRYNQANDPQAVGIVQGVQTYLNELPINSNSGIALSATDANFDTAEEAFEGVIDTNGLSPGKNLLYVQATDGTHAGATYAEFVDVVEVNSVAQVSGTITDAATGAAVIGAIVQIDQSKSLSSTGGSFSQFVQPTSASITVIAENYAAFTSAPLNLIAGEQLTQNIELQPFCEIFNDDVESGNIGWQTQNPWAISTDQSTSPTHAWTDSPGGEYTDNLNISLTSPSIDITDVNTLEVSFMNICDTEATYDFGIFEVQYDNSAWQEISRCDNQTNWQLAEHDLNPPANTSTFKLRFRLDTDVAVTRDGWHIDDITVKASGPVCGQFNSDIIFADGFETI